MIASDVIEIASYIIYRKIYNILVIHIARVYPARAKEVLLETF